MDRIDFVASLCQGLDSICDIGCDHAYTTITAIKKYGVKHAYAMDVNEKPLEMARKNVKTEELQSKVDILLSNGLENFNETANGLVITGMGGLLIADILEAYPDKTRKFEKMILGPNMDSDKLRNYLINKHICIEDEFMLCDKGRYYEIIVCSNKVDTKKYDYFDMKFGPILRNKKSKEFVDFYNKKLEISKKAFKNAKDPEQITKIKLDIAMYRRVLS